jgi:signal peptidase I
MKLSRELPYLALALMTLIIASRFLPIPFGIFTVASGSMLPTIRVLDMVVVFGRDIHVGDIVAWAANPTYCVIHRVVNVTDRYVITKGDANPVPDPPMPLEAVKGRVVIIIPRELWISVLAVSLIYFAYTSRRIIHLSRNAMIYMPILVYVLIVSFSIFTFAAQTSIPLILKQPIMHLSRYGVIDLNGTCTLTIKYYCEGLTLLNVSSVELYGTPIRRYGYNANTLLIEIPWDYALFAASTGARLNVTVKAYLTREGFLVGSYSVPITLQKPVFKVENGSLIIYNPNIFPLKFNITWIYANFGEPWKYNSTTAIIVRGVGRFDPPKAQYIYVDVRYMWLGATFYERLRVK